MAVSVLEALTRKRATARPPSKCPLPSPSTPCSSLYTCIRLITVKQGGENAATLHTHTHTTTTTTTHPYPFLAGVAAFHLLAVHHVDELESVPPTFVDRQAAEHGLVLGPVPVPGVRVNRKSLSVRPPQAIGPKRGGADLGLRMTQMLARRFAGEPHSLGLQKAIRITLHLPANARAPHTTRNTHDTAIE